MSEEKFRIAFLDDRPGPRTTVLRGIRPMLPENWECIECPLLETVSEYVNWLIKENILVLLVDQVLNEQSADSELPVDYKGHDVIQEVRKKIPEFPIVVVTMATEDPDLQHHFGEADAIIDRKILVKDAKQHIPRITRLGLRFLNQYKEELTEFSRLAEKIAIGKANQNDINEIQSIQAKIGISYPVESMEEIDKSLNQFSKEINRLENLKMKIEKFLDSQSEDS